MADDRQGHGATAARHADGRTGLELLQATISGELPAAPIASLLDFRLVAAAHGRAVFRGVPRAQHHNPMGQVHGGWYGAILDSALGCAVLSALPAGRGYTTLEYRVNLIRAIPEGTEVEAAAVVDHAGRSTAVAHAELRGIADGRLYATGSTTCLILAAPAGG